MAKRSVCPVCGYETMGENQFCGKCGRVTNILDDETTYFPNEPYTVLPQQPEPRVRGKGAAIVGMIFGIFSIFLGCVPAFGALFSLISLIISCCGLKSKSGMATAGVVCSSIGLVIAIIASVITMPAILDSFNNYF